jgi:hypothetical protein
VERADGPADVMKQPKRRSKNPQTEGVPLPGYDSTEPRLRELVLVNVQATDGTKFDALLTRVPGIGEEILVENRNYEITRVQHFVVGRDGRAECGWHAFLEATVRLED